ncbi:uncharacterized protein DUF3991 [Pontibacter ummariensis]|uniref:Uncharacterized protein n=1 Tax=Pontibacter ummariensis TaxID=1610492 RepID=A0A239DVK6_9BACT|nr:DUF3991 domain-containing protein [Pontibacter ummariensis]PRY13766.1 uncharacterized protein DUF3991 [Pontibacter ummariensis]SNS35654.1 Protein of unknown function [Pontibacter ummariensis]
MTTFSEYREKVPIIQVAESLGYTADLRKGRRSLEYKHPDGDTVIINSPHDSAKQMYFNRDGSTDKGSVIDFVANRLSQFKESYSTDAEGVNKVLSRFASEPQTIKPTLTPPPPKPFVEGCYEPQTISISKLHYLTRERGLEPETVEKFLPFIRLVKDLEKESSKAYANIAFPLTKPGSDAVIGYDLRNYGFKSVAAGSDRQSGMWIADFAGKPSHTRNVFFAESPIDAMSFYQLRKKELDMDSAAFVSFGGGISKNQIRLALDHWSKAAKNTLFDNDYQGKVYDIALASAISSKQVSFRKESDSLLFTVNDKRFELPISKLSLNAFEQESGVRSGLHVHKARGFKDFNDIIHPSNTNKKSFEMKM